MRTDLVLNALEQTLHHRGDEMQGLVHHSDRGVQSVSMRDTERLADAGIARRWALAATRVTTPWPNP